MTIINHRILAGHRPTGPRHLGHLVGTLQNWVSLQDDHECFFLIADLHVLTTDYQNPASIRSNTLEVVADWLAAGIDPQRSTLILQSAVPEHSQLALLLSMLVTESRLHRISTYREKIRRMNLQPSLGLLTYPVLQAADILLYKASRVPVGEDQLPHIELSREIAQHFNDLYGQLFPEPQALLSIMPCLPGVDNRAMHTSYGNAIFLRDTEEETIRKVMNMTGREGSVEGNPLFTYLELFDPDREQVEECKTRYRQGKVSETEIKQHLAKRLNQSLRPLRERRAKLIAQPAYLREILFHGSNRARQIARQTLEEVLTAMGLTLGLALQPESGQTKPAFGAFC